MDINGTSGDDLLEQPLTDQWDSYFGKGGNDVIRLYQGSAQGGAGNDRIEALSSTDSWRAVTASYWDAPKGVVVDLEGGWAEDGWGTRDTLIGVHHVSGTWFDDRLYGDSVANTFHVGGGHTVVDGRGGDDLVWLPTLRDGASMADFSIRTSIDGTTVVVTSPLRAEFRLEMNNVERIGFGYQTSALVTDFIRPAELATQGLLGGDAQRWNAGQAPGTALELSFGFVAGAPASGPGATGFAAFTEAQRAVVRGVLDGVAAQTGLTFREVDAATARLQFGASAQSDTRGVAGMPGSPGAGQVWMDVDSLRDLTPGSAGYAALLHEIGHALGLRHPRNVDATDVWAQQWWDGVDTAGLTVMGTMDGVDGLMPSGWGALDIAALRTLYGSRAVNAGDTVYLLDTARFQSRSAIVDDGGNDTIDASRAGAGVVLDLTPGHQSSVGVTPAGMVAVNNLALSTDTWIESAVGSALDDVMLGNARDNHLRGGTGNDWIDGGAGLDTAEFEGRRADYQLDSAFGKVFISARDGNSGFDTLVGIEVLRFADGSVQLADGARAADALIDVDAGATVSGQLPATTDGSTVRYVLTQGPANGSATVAADGSFVYTPRSGFSAEDRFAFAVTDAAGHSNAYLAFVSVHPVGGMVNGSSGNDRLDGTAASDRVAAGAGDDVIVASAGSDQIDGGAGMDWVRYAQRGSDLRISIGADGSASVIKPDGTDTLLGVERLALADRTVALDVDGAAGQAYRIYQAAFDRKPDAGGLGFWIASMDAGFSARDVAQGFLQSPEFAALYGAAPSNEQYVGKLYANVLHRPPEQDGFRFWVDALAAGYGREELLVQFADSAENRAQLIGVMQSGLEYTPYP